MVGSFASAFQGSDMIRALVVSLCMLAALTGGQAARAATKLKLIEVLTSPERTENLKSLVANFEKENPGTQVEIISLPWSQAFEKLATMVSAGDEPDVVEIPDRWLSMYVKNGKLENLEPYLAKWSATSALNTRTLDMARAVDG